MTDEVTERYNRKSNLNASAEKTREEPAPTLIPAFKTNVESFSFYFNKDRKLDKGPKVEINSYSQASFGEIGQLNYKEGRYVSKTGGIFMVTATFHVRTEILVIP